MPYRGPPPLSTMTCVHDFAADLAHAGQDAKTILKLCQAAHRDNALSLSQVYQILADVKAGKDVSQVQPECQEDKADLGPHQGCEGLCGAGWASHHRGDQQGG